MDKNAVRSILLALLCIVAIGLAAATLNTAVAVESGGAGTDGVEEPGGEEIDRDVAGPEEYEGEPMLTSPLPEVCIPALLDPFVIVGLLALFAGIGYAARRKFGVLAGVGIVIAYVPLTFILLNFALNCEFGEVPDQTPSGMAVDPNDKTQVADTVRDAGQTAAPEVTLLLFIVLGVALVGLLAVLVSSRRGPPDEEADEDEPDEEPDLAEVGRVAGEAADRIEDEDAEAENEVYRAWREMTTYLDVARPASTTPGEFADAAVEAGMTRADVAELTDLFREVRYGHRDATSEREERALAALRRIEAEYATEDGV